MRILPKFNWNFGGSLRRTSSDFPKIIFFASILTFLLFAPAKSFAEEQKISPFFNFAEFKFSTTLTIPHPKLEKEKAVGAQTGLKISLKNGDLRCFVTLPKTEFQTIKDCKNWQERRELLNDARYGGKIILSENFFPASVSCGMLSFSKSYAKLKNPSPSVSSNPLKKTFSLPMGLGAVLPTLSSSVQPLCFSSSIGVSEKASRVPVTFEFLKDENDFYAASLRAKYSFTKFTSVEAAATGGRFYIENNSKVLSKNNANFEAGWFYAALGEISFRSPFLKTNLRCAIHQSPYEQKYVWLKGDARFTLGFFLLDASYFFIPTSGKSPKVAPLIGGSSSICRTLEQAEINPQLQFLLNDHLSGALRIGFLASEAWKITDTNKTEEYNVLKIGGAVSYENRIFGFRTDAALVNHLLDGNPPTKSSTPEKYYSIGESFLMRTRLINTSLSASYKHYFPYDSSSALKETLDFDLGCSFTKSKSISANSGLSLVFKDKERTSASADANVTFRIQKKYFRSSVKVGISCPF